MSNRPQRTRIVNELGNWQTLPSGPEQFESMGAGVETVFLGLGPQPERLAEWFPDAGAALYVECPEFEAAMPEGWKERIPSTFWPMPADVFTAEFAKQARVIRYRPGLKAFPSFWGPVTARLAKAHWRASGVVRTVWIPGTENDLLCRELRLTFESFGYQVRVINPEIMERSTGTSLPQLLEESTPELVFCVNFKGLDPFGLAYNMLREAGANVAAWCVDNPFSLLTAVKSGYWKEMSLFVTDESFIPMLESVGASSVTHLPLAASVELFRDEGRLPEHATGLENRLVFVGRSEFPDKRNYYAGLRLPEQESGEASEMLRRGERPDFRWWCEKLGTENLWPGNDVRLPGFGAEQCGMAWRTMCLREAPALTVFGDEGWRELLGAEADVREPLDYYAHLPAVYRNAGLCLNMTSPQLPAGLTQRHFDVWMAGGFLITDETPGLDLFPYDLVRGIIFGRPDEIAVRFDEFMSNPGLRRELRAAWESLILLEHTYAQRIKKVLAQFNMD